MLILLCLPLIFSSCQEDDPTPNSTFGTVSMIIDGENRGYSPLPSSSVTSQVSTFNGQLNLIALSFSSVCANNYSDYTLGCTATDLNSLYEGTLFDSNCSSSLSGFSYLGGISNGGTVNISNIDYSNKKISGTFSLYGNSVGRPSVECTFSNVPFTLMAIGK